MHRFVPRHKDEMTIEIGDPIHVFSEADDLWCEGKPFIIYHGLHTFFLNMTFK